MAEVHGELIAGLFLTFFLLLWTGFPIAWVLGGSALGFALVGWACDEWFGYHTGLSFAKTMTFVRRTFGGLIQNHTLVAIPMFIFMGLMLDRSGLARRLMQSLQAVMGGLRGGLAIAATLIGVLLAASTGIVGASVVLLGLLALPAMLAQGYDRALASGSVAAAGTLGILMPPSIMLVLMSDRAELAVGPLFQAAVLPSLLLAALYLVYLVAVGLLRPDRAPLPATRAHLDARELLRLAVWILPPAALIVVVLGSIFTGIATTTEASAFGAAGTCALAAALLPADQRGTGRWRGWAGGFTRAVRDAGRETALTCGYIFAIFLGASAFAFVLRRFGGDAFVAETLQALMAHAGPSVVVLAVLAVVFVLGFFLDWIEISLIVLPLVAAAIGGLDLGIDGGGLDDAALLWFVCLMAICLQTSFLTPPVGFSLFFLKGVAPPEVRLGDCYRGVVPFVLIQLAVLLLVFLFPALALWLPAWTFGDG